MSFVKTCLGCLIVPSYFYRVRSIVLFCLLYISDVNELYELSHQLLMRTELCLPRLFDNNRQSGVLPDNLC